MQASKFRIWVMSFSSENLTKKTTKSPTATDVSKLFDCIIERRLKNEVETQDLIDETQEQVRERRGIGRCSYKLIDIIQNVIGQMKVAANLFIDLGIVFDWIWIDSLMYYLRKAATNSYNLNIKDQYFQNRSADIEIGENRLESFNPKVGLPQGSIFHPIFSSFSLQTCSKNAKVKLKSTPMTLHVCCRWLDGKSIFAERLRWTHWMDWKVASQTLGFSLAKQLSYQP